jgi:hypothetical protein
VNPLAATAAVAGLLAAFLAGYVAGRLRLGVRLVDWAEDQVSRRPWWHPLFPAAVLAVLAAVALAWICHPRRTAANRRSWNAEDTLTTPVPTYEPNWAARRTGGL